MRQQQQTSCQEIQASGLRVPQSQWVLKGFRNMRIQECPSHIDVTLRHFSKVWSLILIVVSKWNVGRVQQQNDILLSLPPMNPRYSSAKRVEQNRRISKSSRRTIIVSQKVGYRIVPIPEFLQGYCVGVQNIRSRAPAKDSMGVYTEAHKFSLVGLWRQRFILNLCFVVGNLECCPWRTWLRQLILPTRWNWSGK